MASLRNLYDSKKAMSQCLKITEKVSFNIEKPKACVQKVLPDISLLIGQKLVENAKIKK